MLQGGNDIAVKGSAQRSCYIIDNASSNGKFLVQRVSSLLTAHDAHQHISGLTMFWQIWIKE